MYLVEDEELIFFKSNKTGRWWIEIPFLPNVNNKLKRIRYYLACMKIIMHACNGKIPERWYKAFKKNCLVNPMKCIISSMKCIFFRLNAFFLQKSCFCGNI